MTNELNAKNMENLIGKEISYNSSASIYTGVVVANHRDGYVLVIEDDASMRLHKSGVKCGSEVHESQIIK